MLLAVSAFALAWVSPQNLHFDLEGDYPEARFGSSVSTAGDVDGDGWDDLLVGAKYHSELFPDGGKAQVFSGRDGTKLFDFWGDAAEDFFGAYVNGLGDLNHDGFADFGVAAKGSDIVAENAGMVRVFSGRDGAVLFEFFGLEAHDFFGQSFVSLGDLDLDGTADVLIGARQSDPNRPGPGYAQVFSGASGKILFTVYGDDDYDWFGKFVGAPGDIDGDGHPDFLVGAKGDDNNGTDAGMVRLFSGVDGHLLHQWDGPAGSWFGTICDAAGDVDGDGVGDILIGAYRNNVDGKFRNGTLFVYSGADYRQLHAINGEDPFDWFSKASTALGDVDGDGCDDFAAGAYTDDNFGDKSGTVRVFSGATGKVVYTFNGRTAFDNLGYSVSAAGDVNHDGITDLLVGARNAGIDKRGGARVFTLWTFVLHAPSVVATGNLCKISLSGASSNSVLVLVGGLQSGTWLLPAGIFPFPASLDIFQNNHVDWVKLTADNQGKAWLWFSLPARLSGREVLFQAVEPSSGTVSNLTRVLVN